jgi:hypothetical protein
MRPLIFFAVVSLLSAGPAVAGNTCGFQVSAAGKRHNPFNILWPGRRTFMITPLSIKARDALLEAAEKLPHWPDLIGGTKTLTLLPVRTAVHYFSMFSASTDLMNDLVFPRCL